MSTSRREAETSGRRRRLCRTALWLGLLSILWVTESALAGSVQIIVNPKEAGTPIDRALLRALFTMRLRQWPDGTPVRVFVLPDQDDASALFCREKLGTYPYVMRSTWDRLIFTGTGVAPTVVESEREMRERVRSTLGAIGYVRGGDTSDGRRSLPTLLMAALAGTPYG